MSQDKMSTLMKDINVARGNCNNLRIQLGELLTQLTENEALLNEMDGLEEDAKMHKLVGVVLVGEPKSDVINTVQSRIKFIKGEIESRKKLISEAEEKLKELFNEVESMTKKKKENNKPE